MLLRIGLIALLLGLSELAAGGSAAAQGYDRRGGRCPNGYDFNGYDCVPNHPRYNRHRGDGYGGGRCPDGYDFTRNGCVPNQPRYYRDRGYGDGGGRCPDGYDWTRRGCVPNRW
jgi:hypothetical protein